MTTEETIQTDLSWVVFAEETAADKCQRVLVDCSNESTHVVTVSRSHPGCIPDTLEYCVSCTQVVTDAIAGRASWTCQVCAGPVTVKIISVYPKPRF